MSLRRGKASLAEQLCARAHELVLASGLLNLAALPLWRLPLDPAGSQGVGYPLFGAGLLLSTLACLALGEGLAGHVEPRTELVTGGVYRWLRHPLYSGFALTMLGLDILMGSASGLLFTALAFLPSMIWRAHLEEQALARCFGQSWLDYARRVPSALLWDCRKTKWGAAQRRARTKEV